MDTPAGRRKLPWVGEGADVAEAAVVPTAAEELPARSAAVAADGTEEAAVVDVAAASSAAATGAIAPREGDTPPGGEATADVAPGDVFKARSAAPAAEPSSGSAPAPAIACGSEEAAASTTGSTADTLPAAVAEASSSTVKDVGAEAGGGRKRPLASVLEELGDEEAAVKEGSGGGAADDGVKVPRRGAAAEGEERLSKVIAVWEFGVRDGFKEFDAECQKDLEAGYQAFRGDTGPAEVKVTSAGHLVEVDFDAMKQSVEGSARKRDVRRREEKVDFVWEFSVAAGFQAFNEECQRFVEEKFKAYCAGGAHAAKVTVGDKVVNVDFKSMQQNLLGSARMRAIRRRPV